MTVEEKMLTGYCRCLDQSRMVTVELDGDAPPEIDCGYGSCIHKNSCAIAEKIRQILEE